MRTVVGLGLVASWWFSTQHLWLGSCLRAPIVVLEKQIIFFLVLFNISAKSSLTLLSLSSFLSTHSTVQIGCHRATYKTEKCANEGPKKFNHSLIPFKETQVRQPCERPL